MKNNSALEFDCLYGEDRVAFGVNRSCETAGDIIAQIARRGKTFRVYAYRWHSEQDASREYMIADCQVRATTPTEAVHLFRAKAERELAWPWLAVRTVANAIEARLDVVIEVETDGRFLASCDIPGLMAYGSSATEATANLWSA